MDYKIAIKKPIPVKVTQLNNDLWDKVYSSEFHSIKIGDYYLQAGFINEQYLYPSNDSEAIAGVVPIDEQVKVFFVNTLEDCGGKLHQAKIDDWLIIGVAGEIYACDKDIFEKTYDIVKEGV